MRQNGAALYQGEKQWAPYRDADGSKGYVYVGDADGIEPGIDWCKYHLNPDDLPPCAQEDECAKEWQCVVCYMNNQDGIVVESKLVSNMSNIFN